MTHGSLAKRTHAVFVNGVFNKRRVLIGAILSLIAVLGCHRTRSELADTLGLAPVSEGSSLWGHDVRELAPIIVVATVKENTIVLRHTRAARFPGVYLDLHRVVCKRENSLKGGLAGPELEFFYFADGGYRESEPDPLYRRFFQAEPGSRYLFFLRREKGVLRAVFDVGEYEIPVSTGMHPEGAPEADNAGRVMAEILLAPGPGADLELLAKRLPRYQTIADQWASRVLSVRLLRRLTTFPEPLRSQACGLLVHSYLGQDDCLVAISTDQSESSEKRREAEQESAKQQRFHHTLAESLKDPAQLAFLDAAGDSRLRVREEFETMLLGTDPVLRERACGALQRYYPWSEEPDCIRTKGSGK